MKLIVDNMSCAHCVTTITQAINQIDPQAIVMVDLEKKEVNIESNIIKQDAAISAIDDAGFDIINAVDY